MTGKRLQIDTHRLPGLVFDGHSFFGRGSECATNGQSGGTKSSWVSVRTQMSALLAVDPEGADENDCDDSGT
jgi:hypothetical protein